jgi:hypothetical protein
MVGTGRFELPACRLGGGRSIQLSYVPAIGFLSLLGYSRLEKFRQKRRQELQIGGPLRHSGPPE